MVEFYLLTSSRFPLRKKKHKFWFDKNRSHGFRTSRCARYLLDHAGDEGITQIGIGFNLLSMLDDQMYLYSSLSDPI